MFEDNTIAACFDKLPEFRVERTRRHKLIDTVFISLCATICGFDGWEEIELFAKSKESWFRRFLELPNGIPSHDTIRRIFMHIDPEAFRQCFSDWVASLGISLEGHQIAIDGKTLRGSRSKAKGKQAIHMVSAWVDEHNLVIGQQKTEEKSNEITAIPKLLEQLVIKNTVISIDAMGCQTAIARQIIDQDEHYVFGLKGNQGTLHEQVADFFETAKAHDFYKVEYDDSQSVSGEHGRIEERHCVAISSDYIDASSRWSGIQSAVAVYSNQLIGGEEHRDVRYFISSLPPVADHLSGIIRRHWGIENGLHWSLDVGFREDDCRIHSGYAAENLAILRHMALHLIKRDTTMKGGIARKRKLAGVDEKYLESILF